MTPRQTFIYKEQIRIDFQRQGDSLTLTSIQIDQQVSASRVDQRHGSKPVGTPKLGASSPADSPSHDFRIDSRRYRHLKVQFAQKVETTD